MRKSLLGILLALFSSGSIAGNDDTMYAQAIIVHFSCGSTDLSRLFALEDKLQKAISSAKVGVYDGNEVATDGSDGFLYMYGPDADRLFDLVKPILKATPFMRGAEITKRYGSPQQDDAKEVKFILE